MGNIYTLKIPIPWQTQAQPLIIFIFLFLYNQNYSRNQRKEAMVFLKQIFNFLADSSSTCHSFFFFFLFCEIKTIQENRFNDENLNMKKKEKKKETVKFVELRSSPHLIVSFHWQARC